jgi:carbonic anhydrase/acetyltransferase-like protein (isoleucine patch superfamily)
MGAIIMNGASIGKGAVVGAGAVVKENMIVKAYELVVGVPGKIVKTLPEEIFDQNLKGAIKYVTLAGIHRNQQNTK